MRKTILMNLIKSIFFISCFLFASKLCIGQNLGFYVMDSTFKIPIQHVTIENKQSSFFVFSNDNGFVNLNKMPNNCTVLKLSGVGYQSMEISLKNLLNNDGSAVIYLSPKVSNLSEITIQPLKYGNVFKTISDLDIHLSPINNSQEVLRKVPGLFIGQHAGGGKAEQIFLRGFDIDHGTDINLTVDGMPVNMVSHAHGQGYADLHFVIPELIEKVNFNKGLYFADKGNFTTAGFVEFRTKDKLERNFVKVEGGEFNTFRAVMGINLLKNKSGLNKNSLYFANESSFTKGYFDSSQDFSRYNATLKYSGKINANNNLNATLTGFYSKWLASGQIPNRAVENGLVSFFGAIDNTEGGNTARYNANMELTSLLPNGANLRNHFFYSNYSLDLYSNFTFFKENPINGDQIKQKENRAIFGYNSSYQNEKKIGGLNFYTYAGLQIRYDDVNDLELSRTANRITQIAALKLGDVNELNAGLYYSQKVDLSSKIALTGALRYDFFNNIYFDKLNNEQSKANGGILSPKLNLDFRINDAVQLYLYNGRGFHSNDTRVAVAQNGKKVLPPAYGTDLGGVFKIGKKLFLQTALWHLWLDQEFVYVGDEGVVEAGGQTRRIGYDVSARYQIGKNLFANLDLSLAKPRALGVPLTESYLPLASNFTSVGGISYKKLKGWNGSLNYRFLADRPANESKSVLAKGYFVTDGALNYTTKKWEAGISIQNILNTKWKETQFNTETQLKNELNPVEEIHFTPGTPFFAKLSFTFLF
jgi:TonB-dependent Receptor Plug Domain